jgi:hypothetical protein
MPPVPPVHLGPRLPLVLTSERDLLGELLRLAAAGGTEAEVAADPASARSRRIAAPLVLVGTDRIVEASGAGTMPAMSGPTAPTRGSRRG